ncbi:MAG: restriction endonuclease subunit S [Clostridiales bacterium]|nr:restriction endonuclease subunit S [Clostridiales bacterium]
MVTWENKPLLECVDLLQGLTYSPQNVKSHGLLVLRSSNVQNGRLAFDDCVFVDCTVDESRYVKPNDILICVRNGSSALIGKSCVIDKAYNATFGAFMSVLRGDKNGYLAHVFASDIVQNQIKNRSSATINQITKRDFEEIVIPIPADEHEQRHIAAALSDTDALITALERLIAKKRAIKQGAMQELLTGKRRLPGFSGERKECTIEEIVERFATGLNPRQNFTLNSGGSNYYVTIKNFFDGILYLDDECDKIDNIALEMINARSDLRKDDILFSSIGRVGDAYLIKETPRNWNINESVFALRPNKTIISPLFLYYLLKSEGTQQSLLGNTTGSTLSSIKMGHLKVIVLSFPKNIAEQTAIAGILSDMDADIEKLTAKLNKLRGIKQGMMSELLTGRIRLIEQDATIEVAEEIAPITQTAPKGHNQQFDDAVMIAGIVNVLYSDRFPLGRKKVQKCLYLLRRYQDESTVAFKKKAAGPYADEVRYKGGEPIAKSSKYITTTTAKKGTTFACGDKINQALGYIESWDRQADIQWVADNLRFKKVDDLELLATVDMAICDLTEAGTPVTVQSIKHLIATNAEWKAKLKKQIFSDKNIARAMQELQTLLQGGKTNG